MGTNPSYYAILTSEVRYDKRLTPNAKLLYAEITALCHKDGRCWASNKYFAELYDVSNTSISKWISQLVEYGYLKSVLIYKDGTKEIQNRYLSINPIEEKLNTPLRKVKYPIEEKLKDNNTSINNISIPKDESLVDTHNLKIISIENRLEFYNNYQGDKMHLAIVFRFFDLLIEKYPNSSTLKSAKLKKWLDEVRLSINNDGTSVERLIAIIEFLKWQVKEVKGIDTFWITQVQSISSIRGKNTQGVFKIDNIASKMNEYINRCPEFKVHIDKEITNFTNKFKTN